MREAADVYGSPEHSRTNATDPSAFGASEHNKDAVLACHRSLLEEMRNRDQTEDAPKQTSNEVGVELAPVQDAEWESMGPIDYTKYLSDKAELTAEQRGPVALLARDM